MSIESITRITAKLKNDLVSVDFDRCEILPFVLGNGNWEYEFNPSLPGRRWMYVLCVDGQAVRAYAA